MFFSFPPGAISILPGISAGEDSQTAAVLEARGENVFFGHATSKKKRS